MMVMAIVATVAVPQFGSAAARYRAALAARKLAADLNLARSIAITRGSTHQVTLDFVGSTYTLVGIADPDSAAANTLVDLSTAPYRSTLVSGFGFALADVSTTISYDAYGTPDKTGNIVVQTGDTQSTILLSAGTGKAEVQ